MRSMAFPGGAAGAELRLGLVARKRSEVRPLKRTLRDRGDPFPGVDSLRRTEEFAILGVDRIFASLVVENRQCQCVESPLLRLTEKAQDFGFERRSHSPMIFTRTRFRR